MSLRATNWNRSTSRQKRWLMRAGGTLVSLALIASPVGLAAAQATNPPTAPPALTEFEASQQHMGVEFRIVVFAPDETTARTAIAAAFDRITALDSVLSDWRADSALNQFCRTPHEGEWLDIDPDLWRVLSEARSISDHTQGAFDVTVGHLSHVWREARRTGRMPTDAELAQARATVDYRLVELAVDRSQARLSRDGMQLDLGAIAKGYAVDEAIAVLRAHGLTRALVAGSGDLAVGDAPPGESAWRIGIATRGRSRQPTHWIAICNAGVATSGDAEQYVVIDGRRFSHVINPATGLGLEIPCSATVIACSAMRADGYATGFAVLGPDRALRLAADLADVEVLLTVAVPNTPSPLDPSPPDGLAPSTRQIASDGFPQLQLIE
jgi:thiamine biosynthesis lipoprotein